MSGGGAGAIVGVKGEITCFPTITPTPMSCRTRSGRLDGAPGARRPGFRLLEAVSSQSTLGGGRHSLPQRRREAQAQPDHGQRVLPHLRVRGGIIIPQALEAAQKDIYGDETRLRTLLRFAEDESKHQELFRRSTALFEKGFGVHCGLIPAREEVARVVLSKSRLCSYLLTSMIEWFTQLHYVEHVRDRGELDGLFRDLVRYHWMDEAQHAKIDSLLIDEIIEEIGEEDRETAVDELLELGGAIDGLLSQQADLDLASLEKAIGGRFPNPKGRDQAEHASRLPLDVPRVGARASQLRPDRE